MSKYITVFIFATGVIFGAGVAIGVQALNNNVVKSVAKTAIETPSNSNTINNDIKNKKGTINLDAVIDTLPQKTRFFKLFH